MSLICGDVDFCTLIKAQGVKLKVKTDSTEVYFLSCTKPKMEAEKGFICLVQSPRLRRIGRLSKSLGMNPNRRLGKIICTKPKRRLS